MSFLNAIMQGLIQGLTEFLPVSSSGHLSVYQYFTGVSSEESSLFAVLLHLGTLAAVFVGRSVGGAEKPNALGTLVGAMLVSTLENGLTICAVSYYVLPAVKGAVLALALVAAYAGKKEQ